MLQLLLSNEGEHWSAEVVYRKLHESGVDVNLATIYRVLTQFEGQASLSATNSMRRPVCLS